MDSQSESPEKNLRGLTFLNNSCILRYNKSMHFALSYLAHRFLYRIVEFLRHWYVKSVRIYSDFVLNVLGRIDYYLAWKITLKYLFQPLYKDYSLIGYILGFLFRSGRLITASIIYGVLFFIAVGLYLFWLLIPIILIYLIFRNGFIF